MYEANKNKILFNTKYPNLCKKSSLMSLILDFLIILSYDFLISKYYVIVLF